MDYIRALVENNIKEITIFFGLIENRLAFFTIQVLITIKKSIN